MAFIDISCWGFHWEIYYPEPLLYGIHTQSQYLGIHFIKLCQRTVERGSLIGSAAGKGKRKSMQHDPFVAVLSEGNLLTIVAF